jgi:hypothetical protein
LEITMRLVTFALCILGWTASAGAQPGPLQRLPDVAWAIYYERGVAVVNNNPLLYELELYADGTLRARGTNTATPQANGIGAWQRFSARSGIRPELLVRLNTREQQLEQKIAAFIAGGEAGEQARIAISAEGDLLTVHHLLKAVHAQQDATLRTALQELAKGVAANERAKYHEATYQLREIATQWLSGYYPNAQPTTIVRGPEHSPVSLHLLHKPLLALIRHRGGAVELWQRTRQGLLERSGYPTVDHFARQAPQLHAAWLRLALGEETP